MNTAAIDFLIASYRVTINSSLQVALVVLAVIGLVITCLLVLRRFKAQITAISTTTNTSTTVSSNKAQPWSLKKKSHCALLLLGNVIVFMSALLFVLPVEEKVVTSSFDILLTQGFKSSDESVDFNILAMDKIKIEQALNSAQRIWLLAESAEAKRTTKTKPLSLDSPLYQWLLERYPDKVYVLNSVSQLRDFWQQQTHGQAKNHRQSYFMPSLLQVYGDGLTQTQWQALSTVKVVNADEGEQESTQRITEKSKHSYVSTHSQSQDNPVAPYDVKFNFFASKAITGLSHLHWSRQVILGQPLTVSGQLQQADEDNRQFQLSLIHNNNVLDKMVITGKEVFSLTATSKIAGLFNYQLVLRELPTNLSPQGINNQGGQYKSSVSSQAVANKSLLDTASVMEISENIAFSVVMGNQPRVLIKQSAPSFETRRLKQWLSQAGSSVHVISQISKNKWAQQKVNIGHSAEENSEQSSEQDSKKSSEKSNQLSEALLTNYDVLIIDSRMLLALNEQEITALYNAVNRGLGLLINADATLLKIDNSHFTTLHKLLSLFELGPANDSLQQVIAQWPNKPAVAADQVITPQAAVISINGKSDATLFLTSAELAANSTVKLSAKSAGSVNIESLVQSMLGQTLVAKKSLGAGSVVISALNQTYPWALQANTAFYSHYWQYILSKTSRSDSETRWLLPMPSLLTQVNHYQDICLLSPLATVHAKQILLTPYPLEQNKQCGRFLARQAGWFEFKAMNEKQILLAKQARYFYDEKDFLAWQQANKHLVSKRWSVGALALGLTEHNDGMVEHNVQANAMKRYQAINKSYLWLLMFITLSLLWLERKWA
ncbi:MAG: hypothetical protein WBC60_03125 [Cognaticolwellia sp.]